MQQQDIEVRMQLMQQAGFAPVLSVLIPVYNVASYLPACVQSIVNSLTAHEVEVILLDDASTDQSPAVMQELAQQFPQLQLLKHEHNQGLAAARNTLLQHAKGSYVWFVDSDDLLAPKAIDVVLPVLKQQAPDLLLCDFWYLREPTKLKHRLRGELHRASFQSNKENNLLIGLLKAGQLHAWSKIARREVWLQARFPEGRYFEDIPVIPNLLQACHRFVHVARPLLGYRQRPGSILASYNGKKLEHLLLGLLDLQAGCAKFNLVVNAEAKFALDSYLLRVFSSFAKHIAKLPEPDRSTVLGRYQQAITPLFPQGIAIVLQQWRARFWWLRAWRIKRQLKFAGFI